jgi:hypothetical protein
MIMDTTEAVQQTTSVELGDNDVVRTSRYLRADDIAESKEGVLLTIAGMRIDTFPDKTSKEVLVFEDGTAVTLNQTRKAELAALGGNPAKISVSAVRGLDVLLSTVKVNNPKGGGKVNSITIKAGPKGNF